MRDDDLRLLELIQTHRFNFVHEKQLQDGLAKVFDEAGLEYERECRLSAHDIIDFMLPSGLGIEVKVRSTRSDLLRQLFRYATHERIDRILVVTNRSHLCALPLEIEKKQVLVMKVGANQF